MCDTCKEHEIFPVDVASFDTSVVLNDENSLTTISEEIEEIYCENFADVTKSAINVQNSSEVVIGPVTQFHGPVTIYQNINGNGTTSEKDPKCSENGIKESKVEFKSDEKCLLKRLLVKYRRQVVYFGIVMASLFMAAVFAIAIQRSIQYGSDFDTLETDDNNPLWIGSHKLIYRNEWGGREPLYTKPMNSTPIFVIISHTVGNFCDNRYKCSIEMCNIQSFHVTQFGSPDIGYNFLIGGDGNIYVGRGWDVQNFQHLNTIGISFMGDFSDITELTEDMNDAGKKLLQRGLEMGKLDPDYKVVCHNQTYNTLSPGKNVYKEVIKWPHYYPENVTFVD